MGQEEGYRRITEAVAKCRGQLQGLRQARGTLHFGFVLTTPWVNLPKLRHGVSTWEVPKAGCMCRPCSWHLRGGEDTPGSCPLPFKVSLWLIPPESYPTLIRNAVVRAGPGPCS